MSDTPSRLPARPSLEQLRKQAKDLLRAARAGNPDATARLRTARSQQAILADAQLAIAREHGFNSWSDLVHHIREDVVRRDGTFARPMIRPVDLQGSRAYTLPDGDVVTTEDVFQMFVAARAGDLRRVKSLLARAPGLAVVEYNYTPPIHFAVREGHRTLVELLIEQGADFAGYRTYPFGAPGGDALLTMAEDREHWDVAGLLRDRLSRRFALASGTRDIIDAADEGDLARVQAELVRDPSLARAANEVGDTALHRAASKGHIDVVQALLAAGADPDPVRGDGYRPIHYALMPNWMIGAAQERGRTIAQLLIERGARYTMFVAALLGDHQFIRDALRRDRSAANEADTCHHRPISAAARRNDLPLAALLLEHGADPSLPEEGAPRGHALWLAVHNRNIELATLLLQHGADPNGMVESSGTPMMMAERDPQLHALLRKHGGIVSDTEREALSRLLKARKFDEAERMVRASPSLLEDEYNSEGLLMGPAHAGNHEALAFLMRMGLRVPTVTKWGPYYYFKHEATAAFLLEHGMDPNHMNWHRVTLLHHTAAHGELNKARLLIDHGAEIDAIDEEYRSTPLALAARSGQRDIVAFLLERGADPNLAGAGWATPLSWAAKKGHPEIANMLRDAGAQ